MFANRLFRSWLAALLLGAPASTIAPVTAHASEVAAPEEGAEAEPGAEAGEEVLPVAPDYMPMPVLNIPVLRQNRVAGRLMIEMVLDVASDETMRGIHENRSRLMAGYTETLGAWAAKFQEARGPAQVIAIKNQLQNVTNTVLARDDAIVLLQSAMMTR
ncbi:MAG: hypothetical protein Dbin4_01588 [Alphaproteobacteria bacterium]|nr:hypothetical protein [Alphaproteobacteria bacterium]